MAGVFILLPQLSKRWLKAGGGGDFIGLLQALQVIPYDLSIPALIKSPLPSMSYFKVFHSKLQLLPYTYDKNMELGNVKRTKENESLPNPVHIKSLNIRFPIIHPICLSTVIFAKNMASYAAFTPIKIMGLEDLRPTEVQFIVAKETGVQNS